MTRKFSEDQQREFDKVKKIVLYIKEFIYLRSHLTSPDPSEAQRVWEEEEALLMEAYSVENILKRMTPAQAMKGAKMALQDAKEHAKDISEEDRQILGRELEEKFGSKYL